jgi:hypothetical protein
MARGAAVSTRATLVITVSAALLLALFLAVTALAQVPEKQQRFVYGLNVFDGTEYATGFVPPVVDTVYAFADTDTVLDPKITEVYFWPITNEFRADFTALNQLVPGQLQVTRGGRVVELLQLTDYVLQFDPATGMGSGRVFLGDDAHRAWQHFQDDRAAYLDRLRQHSDAVAAYSQQLDDARSQADAGNQPATPPQPPPDPAPLTLYSSEVTQGFGLHLPAGDYQINLRDDAGQIVPDSAKQLVVVAPRRQGVGFDVVPQERWTYPQQASDPSDIVYTMAGGVAYLEPSAEHELNAVAAARLKDPQSLAGTANRWEWVQIGSLSPATLVVTDGQQERRQQIQQFAVQQVPGAELGYKVVPFGQQTSVSNVTRTPDITAFQVVAPDGRRTLSLRLVDSEGRELAGSERQLAVVSSVPGWQLALPVLVPLGMGLSVILWRREQIQYARSLPAEQRQRLV